MRGSGLTRVEAWREKIDSTTMHLSMLYHQITLLHTPVIVAFIGGAR